MATDFNALYAQLQEETRTAVISNRFANDVISIHNPNQDPNNPKAVYDDLLSEFSMRVTEHIDPSSLNTALAHSVEILTLAKDSSGQPQGVYLEGDWAGYTFQEAEKILPGDDASTNTGHFEALHGTYYGPKRSFNDNFTMSDLNDIVNSKTGNDTISAGAGDDIVYAGSGNDFVDGGSGRDFLFGEDGDDRIDGGANDDHIEGGNGADTLTGGTGDDEIFGGAGSDNLFGEKGNDTLFGGAGDDIFFWNVGDGVDYCVESTSDAGTDAIAIIGTSDLYVIKSGNHLALGTDDNNWAIFYNWYLDQGIEAAVIGEQVYSAQYLASIATDTTAYSANTFAVDETMHLSTEGLTPIDFKEIPAVAPMGISDMVEHIVLA